MIYNHEPHGRSLYNLHSNCLDLNQIELNRMCAVAGTGSISGPCAAAAWASLHIACPVPPLAGPVLAAWAGLLSAWAGLLAATVPVLDE